MPRRKINLTPPDDFTPNMVAAWNTIVEDLSSTDSLERTDRVLIEGAAVMWGRFRDVRGLINDGGYITPSVRGTTSNPLLSTERESLKELRLLCDQLPLTSAARKRLGLSKDKKADPFADLDQPLRAVK